MVKTACLFIGILFVSDINVSGQMTIDLAFNEYRNGDFKSSFDIVNEVINTEPSAEAFMLRGDCYHKLSEFELALEDYDRARINGCDDPELLLHRGICKVNLARYEEGKVDLIGYLQIHPEDARPYYWMASSEYFLMETKSALRYIDQAIMNDSLFSEAYYLRAAVYSDLGKTLAAYEDFKTAFTINPGLIRARMYMATFLMDLGNDQQALEILDELAVAEIDFLAEVLYYRGHVLYNLHDLDAACNSWVESARLGDEDSEASYKKACRNKSGVPRLRKQKYVQF